MTDPKPSCLEIARQIITDLDRTAFLSKADNWREQITEALEAKQKEIESLRAEVERLREVKIISIKDSSGGTYEHTAEVVSLKSQLSRLKEILKVKDEALRTVLKRGKNIQLALVFCSSLLPPHHSDQYLNEVLGACREALSKTWEEGEK